MSFASLLSGGQVHRAAQGKKSVCKRSPCVLGSSDVFAVGVSR